MNRNLCIAAFFLGLAAVGWVGAGYVATNPLALAMTLVIGAVYGVGALELLRFHQATAALARALAAIPEDIAHLGEWLGQLPPSLRNPVRLRVEGERAGLPGPAMTPYLVGLLVMLGMLGTFLGMVVTLHGAVLALDSTTDLHSIRAALAAPVKGLGLAFGTSVAGVAASAMLGLVSALCRRERLQAAQLLDTRIATVLRPFSLVHQRQETFRALQLQSQALPAVADKLQAMMVQLERQNQQLNERLLAGQDSFHQGARAAYSELAAAVDRSLRESLAASARLTGEAIQPVVEATLAGLARESALVHQAMADTVKARLDDLAAGFQGTAATVAAAWTAALARHEQASDTLARGLAGSLADFARTFESRSAALVATVGESHSALQADLAARDQERLAAWNRSLEAMAASLQREWQAAGAQTLARQERICAALEETARDIGAQARDQARETLDEIARLLDTAAAAPRAAAEVIGELRAELSASLARDNQVLEERGRLLATLDTLLHAINQGAAEQRGAIDALVASAATLLDRAGARFSDNIEAESARMAAAAAQVTGSAVEVASLGEAFGFAVELFSTANDKLVASLQRIEGALNKSMARSDDQLAYYVAQAREIIDLSVMSQKQVVDDLRRLALAGEVG